MISRIVFGGGFHKKKRKAVKKMQNRPYITFQVERICFFIHDVIFGSLSYLLYGSERVIYYLI